MDDLILQDYAGTRQQKNAEVLRIAEFLKSRDYTATPESVGAEADEAVKTERLRQAEELVSNPTPETPDRLRAIAGQLGEPADSVSYVEAADYTEGQSMPEEQRRNFFSLDHRGGTYYALKRLDETRDRMRAEDLDAAQRSSPLASALRYADKRSGDIVRALFVPGWSAHIGKLLQKYDGAGLVTANLHGEDARRRVTKLIETLPNEQSKALVDDLISTVESFDGWQFEDNNYAKMLVIEEFLQPLRSGDPNFFTLDVVQPIEYIGAVIDAGALAKGGAQAVRATRQLYREFTSLDKATDLHLSHFDGVAAGLVSRAKSPEAMAADSLRKAGAGAGQVVETLVAPKLAPPKTLKAAQADLDALVKDKAKVQSQFDKLRAKKTKSGDDLDRISELKNRLDDLNRATKTARDDVLRIDRGSVVREAGKAADSASPGASKAASAASAVTKAPPLSSFDEAVPEGRPFYADYYFTAEEKLRKSDDLLTKAKVHFGERLSDTHIDYSDTGIDATIRVGDSNGYGFAKAEDAQRVAAELFDDGKFVIEKDLAGNYQIAAKRHYAYTEDDLGPYVAGSARGWRGGLGAAAQFDEKYVRSAITASVETAKAHRANRLLIQKINSLPKESSKSVTDFLTVWDGRERQFTLDDMIKHGLTEPEIKAIEDLQRLFKADFLNTNELTRRAMEVEGYKLMNIRGADAYVQEVPLSRIPAERAAGSRVIDLNTGKPTTLSNVTEQSHRVFLLAEPNAQGYSIAVTKATGSVRLRELPEFVMREVPNYLPRSVAAPYIVTRARILEDGSKIWESYKTAQSRNSAERASTEFNAAGDGHEYSYKLIGELAEKGSTLDLIIRARELGLLSTSHRKLKPLEDVEEGKHALRPVLDSIDRLSNSLSFGQGLGKWVAAQKAAFDKTYGKALGWKLSMDNPPPRPAVGDPSLYNEALRRYNHIRQVAGFGTEGALGNSTRSFRNDVADFFYNWDVVPGFREIGDNVSGLNPRVLRGMKSTAATAYLTLNVFVQPFVQTGQVLNHLGVDGALKYALKNSEGANLFDDIMLLSFANSPKRLEEFRKAAGIGGKRMDMLLEQYRASGLNDLVSDHIMVAGTVGRSRSASRSRSGRVVASTLNGVKSVGLDVGISIDKKVAWLVARNRLLERGIKLDEAGLRKAAQDAEIITGNQNRSDPLVNSKGILSLFTQFKTYPIKMTNRLLGAVSNGKYGKEVGLSAREQQRMVALSALSWGAGGFGATEVVERLNVQLDLGLTDQQKLVMQEGIQGTLYNEVFRLFDEEGEDTRVQTGKRFSAFSTALPVAEWAVKVAEAMTGSFKGDGAGLERWLKIIPDAAAFGPLTNLAGGVTMVTGLRGIRDYNVGTDIVLASVEEVLRTVPPVNNLLKARMADNIGYIVNSNGDPVVKATGGAVVAQMFGLNTYSADAVTSLKREWYGPFDSSTPTGAKFEVDQQARATFNYVQKLYRNVKAGTEKQEKMLKFLEAHDIAWRFGLGSEAEYFAYRDKLAKMIWDSGIPKDEDFFDILSSGRDTVPESFKSKLQGVMHPEKFALIEALFAEEN